MNDESVAITQELKWKVETFRDVPRPIVNTFNNQKYWKNSTRDPELVELANGALSVPSSQVSVERSFSILTLIFTDRRTRISNLNLSSLD